MRGIFHHYTELGVKTILSEGPGWIWTRLLPPRKRSINANGYLLHGIPIHIVEHGKTCGNNPRNYQVTVNFYDHPGDFYLFLHSLLGYAAGRNCGLTVNYPVDWKREFRHSARNLLRGKRCFFSAWRIYGKNLKDTGRCPITQ
jgi:hypothetical protein